ncbi:MAG TPA: AsnC family transcriptional regulator, partial [Candidatus Altiarchaeales archaeon]|nr:AsnC family transcriptional regulator [Candidatus Altiarchaeales archaeon]
MKIDKLDVEIIKNLQQDARLSFRELGQKLNVPHTTVFTRADRLVEKGI